MPIALLTAMPCPLRAATPPCVDPLLAEASPDPTIPLDAFFAHVRDAIALNRARWPLYERASGGRSASISRMLIGLELLALPVAVSFDAFARRHRRAGIPLLSDELMPMANAPSFAAPLPSPGPIPAAIAGGRALSLLARDLERALADAGLAGVAEVAEQRLGDLAAHPAFFCMTRHLLESIRRAARLAPRHLAAARERGLPSTTWLSRQFVRVQIATLGPALRLDRRAAPLQADGIPLVCRDLPPIPAP